MKSDNINNCTHYKLISWRWIFADDDDDDDAEDDDGDADDDDDEDGYKVRQFGSMVVILEMGLWLE